MTQQATCPHCGLELSYQPADAGGLTQCPGCAARITLPLLAAVATRRHSPLLSTIGAAIGTLAITLLILILVFWAAS